MNQTPALQSITSVLYRALKGPYQFDVYEPISDKTWLMKCSYPDFDITAFYEITLYRRRYLRWFVPNQGQHVAKITLEGRGSLPKAFAAAITRDITIPVEGVDGKLSRKACYDLCIQFSDVLSARLRLYIKDPA